MKMSISFADLDKLEYIASDNELPNFDEFVDKYVHKDSLNKLYEIWCNERPEHHEIEIFEHELKTLLLNAKFYAKNSMFGMAYGNLAAITYVNNSIPNLLEFCVIKR